jgi:heme A synthase
MYETLQNLHSLWAYFVLFILVMTVINSWVGLANKKLFGSKDLRVALFTLILTHLQVLIGLAIYFMSPYFKLAKELGMGAAMKDSTLRLYVVEHPLVMILSVVLITIGFSKQKKKLSAPEKYKTIAVFYSIALVLILSRLPWSAWLA